ncbi:Metallo-beta-lactamase family protein [Thauera humireducens]|nr:Metallo-beta-lactamase family protein [Thauera humireducens]
MHFQAIEGRDTGLIGYLLSDPDERVSVIVDPPRSCVDVVLALLAEHRFRLLRVLRTHVHEDDRDDCTRLCVCTGALLSPHVNDAETTQIVFGGEVLRPMATPGHTPRCVSYLWRDRLLCGDLFNFGSCISAEHQADLGRLFDSLTRRVFTLPDSTLVFPAHPVRGRHVATLAELRQRYASILSRGREAFMTETARRHGAHARPPGFQKLP